MAALFRESAVIMWHFPRSLRGTAASRRIAKVQIHVAMRGSSSDWLSQEPLTVDPNIRCIWTSTVAFNYTTDVVQLMLLVGAT